MKVPLKPFVFLSKIEVLRLNTTKYSTILVKHNLVQLVFVLTVLLLFPAISSGQNFRVVRVLDGDTLVLDNGERVRLIGVDTTEKSHPLKPIEYFSEEAAGFTRNLVEGREVTLEYDEERRGKYGRLLAYVYLTDGTFVNADIVKQGYGFAYTKYPFKYKDLFVSLEKEAAREKRGYWQFGGKGELKWILGKDQEPFSLYQMSSNRWGVKYAGFIRTRLTSQDLVSVLDDLRRWVYEYHEDDLKQQLVSAGWERLDAK